MTKEDIFQEITGNPNIHDLSIGDRMQPDEIIRAMDMWGESRVVECKKSIKTLYEQWCKQTKRKGNILIGGSINEFFEWLETNPTQE